ncbi:MAG: FAD/FMN-containing dehydrogenases [uncultured Thiotrichaceae bacterium]|uniref:FAD/FMN-containing dehydrogenases n=1 Tax=uncultured Thiotrichaceae bacterium TaxID=298394 RepID=A0A6S6U2T6_9GAMM|nr:MAG: FAD/FMN-containing dehydrogenases [uncultured Thiotrichaceae bacterium]
MSIQQPIREIPYNYTSFSDKEIVTRLMGASAWEILESLRKERATGISSHMLLEMLGDMWVVSRNPYIQDDLLKNKKRQKSLIGGLQDRIKGIEARAGDNPRTLELLEITKKSVKKFSDWFVEYASLRAKAQKRFNHITSKNNIQFHGFARVSHVTDATDWRVELPFVVLTPDTEEEIAGLVEASIELGLTVIPRGGGTGYTGGAIPLDDKSVVINTEKLESLSEVSFREDLPGVDKQVPVVRCGAGVVTKRVSELASTQGLVFAVDPTSQEASTIGGNVSMNAGGKKAVLWGTTLDNLASWKMVTPDATWIEVKRLNHNLGKIHDQQDVQFEVTHFKQDGVTPSRDPEVLEFKGQFFRKEGLGKDVTDKFLGGLPGIQKEGCDGLITSAEFVLHRMPEMARTVCLEFYGTDLHEAVPAIVEIKDYLDNNSEVLLSGLEHLDERYVKAVKYTPKSTRRMMPKMILIADIVGNDESEVAKAASKVVELANARQAEGFIAVSPEARRQFWLDRSRTAAIAAHTNAFKINEDVVIPLHNLATYSEGIERINIHQSTQNKLRLIDELLESLLAENKDILKTPQHATSDENNQLLDAKKVSAQKHLSRVKNRWMAIQNNIEAAASEHLELLDEKAQKAIRENDRIVDLLLRRDLRISYHTDIKEPMQEIFSGLALKPFREQMEKIHKDVLSSRLFVALHMHAGDGNVHTNIPVNSNDYMMMHEAELIVDEVMDLAHRLDGVISGEHGIGLTKIQYQPDSITNAFAEYKERVDPKGHFNKGKLMPGSGLDDAYTPSLRLVEREALLLEHNALGALNDDIKDCLRCGKCKPVCNTHIPRANLLYSPRNKILATGLMIEAFMYEEQTQRGIALDHFIEMNDVADHCTVCHKCLNPCPVNIDFGDVTVRMREILKNRKVRKSNPITWASMQFLNIKDPLTIKLMRKGMIEYGYKGQRLANKLTKNLSFFKKQQLPNATTGKPNVQEYVVQFVKNPLPKSLPPKTTRALLNLEDDKVVPILRDTQKEGDAVFYFPGCGSERLFSQVGMATLAMLYETGATTVLPPGYLCCGYPQTSSGDTEKGTKISTDNRVLFHRIAHALKYLDIKTVIVSCGTCMDQLLKYEFDRIFPGCRLLDIHEYLKEKNVKLEGIEGTQYLYHDPCHSPMKQYEPTAVASELMGQTVLTSDRCCGEAGTFAVSRPDIATQLRFRKEEEIKKGIKQHTGEETVKNGNVKMLTSCPACQQGLSRYADSTGIETDYIVVEIANNLLGKNWQKTFVDKANNGGTERVLL